MKKIIFTILIVFSVIVTFSQNDKPFRDEFTLNLPVDGKQFYEQKIEKSAYFVKENILQIYPGEKLFIEVETKKKKINSMKVVAENLNPEKTLQIEFNQTVKDSISQNMMLKITNPFKYDLEYQAMMFIIGHNQWLQTDVIPVKSGLVGFELWNDIIISLVLTDWKLE